MKKRILTLLLILTMILTALPLMSSAEADKTNLFNKDDPDNWLKSLSYQGSKLTNESNYANMFATHEIPVSTGMTLTWGPFGNEFYCLEWWKTDGTYGGQVNTSATVKTPTGNTVAGVGGNSVAELMLTYTFDKEYDLGKVRLLGNISTMDEFAVYVTDAPSHATKEPIPLTPHEEPTVLKGKRILFCGDSIMSAEKDDYHPLGGYALRIQKWNEAIITNKGQSGTSVSTIRGGRIIHQLVKRKYDIVVLEGGVNDAMGDQSVGGGAPLGKLTADDVTEGFDISTFAGAMEELLSKAKEMYPDAIIGYIISYTTPNSTWGGRTRDFSAEAEIMRKACEKWDIDYIDLHSGKTEDGKYYSKDILKTDTAEFFYNNDPGEVHISGAGYDIITPYIEQWLIDLCKAKDAETATTEAETSTELTTETSSETETTSLTVTSNEENTTVQEVSNDPETTTENKDQNGCKSSIALSGATAGVVAAIGYTALKKRKDEEEK